MASEVTVTNTQSWADFFSGTPPKFVFEDDQCFVIDEENYKQAPVHFLVIPKRKITRLVDATVDDEKLLGHLLIIARRVAKMKGIDKTGFRVVMNEGPHSCQAILQFYVHVLGHMLLVAKEVATFKGIGKTGYHVMVDENHRDMKLNALHVFGRALHHMVWPMGPGAKL